MSPGGVPDSATPVEAWRTWLIWGVPDPGSNRDITRIGSMPRPGFVWPVGAAHRATCRKIDPCDGAPGTGCACGYYGLTAAAFTEEMNSWDRAPFAVLGKVHLWGRTIVCERGWRAEFAYPSKIYLPSDSGWKSGELRQHTEGLSEYSVPVDEQTMVEIMREAARDG